MTQYERYHARKDAGLCPICGKEPMPGKVQCVRCDERNHRIQVKCHDKRRALHQCLQCGKPLPAGWKTHTCAECIEYEKKRKHLQKERKKLELQGLRDQG